VTVDVDRLVCALRNGSSVKGAALLCSVSSYRISPFLEFFIYLIKRCSGLSAPPQTTQPTVSLTHPVTISAVKFNATEYSRSHDLEFLCVYLKFSIMDKSHYSLVIPTNEDFYTRLPLQNTGEMNEDMNTKQ